jgi:hypothetical protein
VWRVECGVPWAVRAPRLGYDWRPAARRASEAAATSPTVWDVASPYDQLLEESRELERRARAVQGRVDLQFSEGEIDNPEFRSWWAHGSTEIACGCWRFGTLCSLCACPRAFRGCGGSLAGVAGVRRAGAR